MEVQEELRHAKKVIRCEYRFLQAQDRLTLTEWRDGVMCISFDLI
jgi:hypothetical protein